MNSPGSDPPRDDKNIAELVELARGGNEIAFETLHRLLSIPIYKYLLRLINNPEDAEELVEETFMRAWEKLPSLQDNGRFKSWLYKIASNKAIDRFRKVKPIFYISNYSRVHEVGMTIEERIEENEFINMALKNISEKHRMCLLLHLDGFPHTEIAAILDLAEGSIATYLSQARTQFRRAYRELKDESEPAS